MRPSSFSIVWIDMAKLNFDFYTGHQSCFMHFNAVVQKLFNGGAFTCTVHVHALHSFTYPGLLSLLCLIKPLKKLVGRFFTMCFALLCLCVCLSLHPSSWALSLWRFPEPQSRLPVSKNWKLLWRIVRAQPNMNFHTTYYRLRGIHL